MANLTSDTPRVSIGSFDDYADAERAVDFLSDQRFPVENLTIVGRDLQMVEQVIGRLTWGRAALAGLGAGAWFGLLVGLLFAIFAQTTSGGATVLLGGLIWGAAFGAIFGAVGYGLTGGRRDFVSRSAVVPTRYELLVSAEHATGAQNLLAVSR